MRPGVGQVAIAFLAILALSAAAPALFAQDQSTSAPAPQYSAAQLDQLVAPIALYPDVLLGQILMASTYPLEVVEAARWVQEPANAALKGDALTSALDPLDWDPSVKALVPFPSVLRMMDKQLDWTQRLGDAFLAQQADVMDAVQRLRRQALAAGTLKSTPQQTVTDESGTIYIAPASPVVVYVPAYDPGVVYAPWPYPDYPPYYFPPLPAYYYGYYGPSVGIYFSVGFPIIFPFWGWGHVDWHLHSIHVDPHRVNQINHHHNERFHRPPFEGRDWQHDPQHRVGVPYRSPPVRARFEPRLPGSPQNRYEYRGHQPVAPAERGLRTPPPVQHAAPRPGERPAPQAIQRPPPIERVAPRPLQRPMPQVLERPAAPIYQRSRSGEEARQFSTRGQESRQSVPPPRSAPPQGGVRRAAPRSGGSHQR